MTCSCFNNKFVYCFVIVLALNSTLPTMVIADGSDYAFRERFQDLFGSFKRNGSSFKVKPSKLPVAIGTNYGTQGTGISLTAGFSPRFSFSIAANLKNEAKQSAEIDELTGNFQTRQKMSGVDTDLRFHPWTNGFFASIGARYNKNYLSKSTTLQGNDQIKLGGQSYGAQSITSFEIQRSYNRIAPRLLIGFDNSVHTSKRFGFHLTAGYMYQGKGSNSYSVEYANNLNPLTNLNLPEKIESASTLGFGGSWDKSLVPVVSAGLKIRF